MTLSLRRQAHFSAGFLHAPPGEASGGRAFQIELTVAGYIDPQTGMVVNIKDIDTVLQERVVRPLHGKILDRDIAALRDLPLTAVQLVRFIWDECAPALPPQSTLRRVSLRPSPTEWAEALLTTEETPMFLVTRAYHFSASHRLHSAALSDEQNSAVFGKCNWPNGHGHNYEVEVTLTGTPDPRTGQIGVPEILDAIVNEEVLRPYDHRHLNLDAPEFAALNPTSENLTRVIWDKLERRLMGTDLKGAKLYKVLVRETERNVFEYYGEK